MEQWRSVVSVLARIIPFYEQMNHVMSFGKDIAYRELGISRTLSGGEIVLDVGSGPGIMIDTVFKMDFDLKDVVLLDALPEMMTVAKGRLGSNRVNTVIALFEYCPFRDNSFNAIMGGFAFRDALDLNRALGETIRVLKGDFGKLLIVDLGKPDNPLFRVMISLYWRLWVPFMALIVLGRRGRMYSKIHETYKRLPKNGELKAFLEKCFKQVSFITKLGGGVIIVICTCKNNDCKQKLTLN